MTEQTKELTTKEPVSGTDAPVDIEARIKEISQASVNVSLPPNVLARLTQKAAFVGLSLEEHLQGVILDSVSQDVGAPVISGPSSAKHKKIQGPSWATGEMS